MPESLSLDVLALAAHPDDVELCAGGTMCLLARQGYRTGIVDFTRGDLGTRGTPEQRMEEAAAASRILGLAARENLGMPDGHITGAPDQRLAVIRALRKYRPHILLINPPECRHPDHAAASELAASAAFYSGLRKIVTQDEDENPQEPWRPHHVVHYMQSVPFTPTFIVDVSDVWDQRMAAMRAYRTQFHDPGAEQDANLPATFIANPEFTRWIEAQARWYGYKIGATYGEPFLYRHGPFGVDDMVALLKKEKPFR